ncbi:putative F-box protein At5g55150 [Solanum dulcamara]|uniref:putative F-box protein At5g55150 n=1 Tax=Solanum dulcamara TaxID=45834 RepID=UPI002485403D|nr:putative F-box protein At5g55150 [Solanum dulcamara]
MSDWSELHRDLLVLVVRHINLIEDYLNFGTVCKSWHSVATKDNFNSELVRVPWLMLAEEEDDDTCRKFFSLSNGMILKKSIPGARGKRCVESMGWLVTVGKEESEINMLHPFSGVKIQLPHRIHIPLPYPVNNDYYRLNDNFVSWVSIHKAVLSANPSHTSDYILMIIEGDFSFLCLWRPGDLSWTRLPGYNGQITDVVCFNGNFYAINYKGCILVCDVAGSKPGKNHMIAQLEPCIDGIYYILESLGSLFVAVQQFVYIRYVTDDRGRIPLTHIPGEDDDEENISYTYRTKTFLVYKFDLDNCKATQTRDLGDRAFFLGPNASLSVQASQFPGIKPNHIYFTDNCLNAYLQFEGGVGLDMGVFNLADESIQPHYDGVSLSRVCPPIWVTPNLC